MQAHRVEATVSEEGAIILPHVPFAKGGAVEVILLAGKVTADSTEKPAPNPRQGALNMDGDPKLAVVLNYDPTEPATEEEWPSDCR